jgi:hypothetical protein
VIWATEPWSQEAGESVTEQVQDQDIAVSTLVNAISAFDTVVTVADPSGFSPTATFTILIDRERMEVTNVAGAVFTVTRGVNSHALGHAAGATVTQILDARALETLAGGGAAVTSPLDMAQVAAPATPGAGHSKLWWDTDGNVKRIDPAGTKHIVEVGPTRGDIRSYSHGSDPVGDYGLAFGRALAAVSRVYVPRGIWPTSTEVILRQHQEIYSDAAGWDDSKSAPTLGAIIQAIAAMRSVVRLGTPTAPDTINSSIDGIVADGNQLATSAIEVGNDDGTAADAAKLFRFKAMNALTQQLLFNGNQCRMTTGSLRCNVNVANPGIGLRQMGSDMISTDVSISGGNRTAWISGDEGVYVGGVHWTGNSTTNSTENLFLDTVDRILMSGIVFDTAGPLAVAHIHLKDCIRCQILDFLVSNQYALGAAAFPAILLESSGVNCSNNSFGPGKVCVNGAAHAGYTFGWQTLGGPASKFFGNELGPKVNFGSIVGVGGVPGGPATAVFDPASVMPRIVRPVTQVTASGVITEVGQIVELTDAVTIAADFHATDAFHLTNWVTGHTLGAPSNLAAGMRYTLILDNSTGGALTLNFNAAYHLLTGGSSVVVAGGKTRILTFVCGSNGTTMYETQDSGDLTT